MKILRRTSVNGSSAFLIVVILVAATLYWVAARAQGQPPTQPQTPQVQLEPWNNTGIMALMRPGAPRGGPPPNAGAGGREGAGAPRAGGPAPGRGFAIPPAVANIAGPDGPAPSRDLTGIWDAGFGGIMPTGLRNPPPLTPWGEALGRTHKSGDGIRMVPTPEINDPLSTLGDPGGYPRQLFFELRPVQFVHTPESVLALFMWERRWRTIWTDGRQLPTDPDPRWYGYSIGRWENENTFVINSNGTDERTWLDNAGNPHSSELRVEERWHRISRNRLELSVTLNDPKTYTSPWVAVDKLQLIRLPPNTDLMEMMNSASEAKAVAEAFKKETEGAK
jgi:hypothetical protein